MFNPRPFFKGSELFMNDFLSVAPTHFPRSLGQYFSVVFRPHLTSLSPSLSAVRTSHHVTFPL